MSESDFEPWEHLLGQRLIETAFKSDNELAWLKDDAIEAIETLERQGRHILGVDVWIVRGSTVTPVIFDWTDQETGDDPRFPAKPADFVRRFSWDIIPQAEESLPYFNLTVL